MIPAENELKDRLFSSGWELIEFRKVQYLWVGEIWQIKSVWSPTDCIAYLTFEIDFQLDSKDLSKIDQVTASLQRPIDWFVNQGEEVESERFYKSASVFLGRGREKYLDGFIEELAGLRHEFEGFEQN